MNLNNFIWRLYCHLLPNYKESLYKESIHRFQKKMMDPNFNYNNIEKINPYFEKWGFKFSTLETDYYAKCTGIESNLYVPIALYEKFIYPLLNPDSWRIGYCDKNMFPRFLNIEEANKHISVMIPEYIAYRDNGFYYLNNDIVCSEQEAFEAVLSYGKDVIIKPTIDSWHGRGVEKIMAKDMNYETLKDNFERHGQNFTIQKVIHQHPDLALFNPTSVNTIRITTYRDYKGKVKVLYASQRFGGKGKVYDNADDPQGSGGFCPIMSDGIIKREIHRYRNLNVLPLPDNMPKRIPFYDRIVSTVLFMHTRFPQFRLIGWDMTVTPEGIPLIIEYNLFPGLGTGQLAHGPMFSEEDLNEIMERVVEHKFWYTAKAEITFKDRKTNTILRNIK